MSRIKLPRATWFRDDATTVALPTPGAAVAVLVGRRQFLRALGLAGVVLALPWQRAGRAWAAGRGRFFTAAERRTLDALVDSLLPPDADPGARSLGVPRYIEQLLTAFEARIPRLYAGGPFSGRNPFPDYERGAPARRRPRNDFKHFIEPSRLQRLYWRWEIFGTSGLSAAERTLIDPLDAQAGGPLTGLRDVYRTGLAQLDTVSRMEKGKPFAKLTGADQLAVRKKAKATFPVDARRGRGFVDLVLQHTIEGAFAAPEYGGNRGGRGWKMLRREPLDSQPLGYALYSRADDAYHERADAPLSTPDPDEIAGPLPISAEAEQIQTIIVVTTDGLGDGC